MFGYVCDYALVSPAVLASFIERRFKVLTHWVDRDEDSFFFTVYADEAIKDLVDEAIAPYFFKE